jgi:hypothetical protein
LLLAIAERKEYRMRQMMCDACGGWEVGALARSRTGLARLGTMVGGGASRRPTAARLVARWRRMALGPGAGERRAIARDGVAIVLVDSPVPCLLLVEHEGR